jgi:hypothetical protein
MNVIDKRKMLEGLAYNISITSDLTQELTEEQIDALIHVRDTMRRVGLSARADEYGRIIVLNKRQFPVATALVI